MARIDDIKHDADVLERVLGFADQPPNYAELHTDVVDVEVHPLLTKRQPEPVSRPSRPLTSIRSGRDRS